MNCEPSVRYHKSRLARLIVLGCVALLFGCSSSVDPISIHDQSIPTSDRRLIADGQDRVAVARAKYDEAHSELLRTEQWRSEVRSFTDWPSGTSALVASLERLLDARIELLDLERDRAEVEIDVSKAELELLIARVAVRNDRAVYDLDDIRDEVDDRKEEARELDREIMRHMEELDRVTQQWWNDYSSFAQGGGDVTAFYTVFNRPRR